MRRKLLCVLDAIEFSQDIPDLLQLDFFERAQIELVITNCEHVNEQGHTVCNVKVSDPLTSRFKDKKYLKCELIQRVRVYHSCCIEFWWLKLTPFKAWQPLVRGLF